MSFTQEAEVHQMPVNALESKRVAVDSYLQLYKYLTAIRGSQGDYQRNDDGEPISHLIGMMKFSSQLLEARVKPVFVFEGGYPDLKKETLSDRGDKKSNARDEYEAAKERGDDAAMRKWGPRTTRVTDHMVDECKSLFDSLGVPYVDAETEADPQCAKLMNDGVCDYVLSDDSDVLLYGADAILRNWDGSATELLPRKSILDNTGLTMDELVQTQILIGCDYNDGAHGVGWVTAQKYVNQSETFTDAVERALEKDSDVNPKRMHRVYEWFQDPAVKPVDEDDLEFRDPPRSVAQEFLLDKGLAPRQVHSALEDA